MDIFYKEGEGEEDKKVKDFARELFSRFTINEGEENIEENLEVSTASLRNFLGGNLASKDQKVKDLLLSF